MDEIYFGTSCQHGEGHELNCFVDKIALRGSVGGCDYWVDEGESALDDTKQNSHLQLLSYSLPQKH